ncbi:MAG: 4Fe-4S dicluster domain-containing protein [Thermoplasmata archaeon]
MPTPSVELLLAVLAALMAYTTAVLVKWAVEAKTPVKAGIVVFLLVMMAAMLAGAGWYFTAPSLSSFIAALWISGAAMSVSVFPLFFLVLRQERERFETEGPYTPAPLRRQGVFTASVVGLVLLNEFLMAWTFQLAVGALSPPANLSVANILILGVDSPWFLFPMALEMGLTVWLLRSRLPRAFVGLLMAQSALMFLSAPAFSLPAAADFVIVLGSGLMIGIIVFVMEYLYRHRQMETVLSGYFLGLLSVYALMMAGLYTWIVYGSGLLFASSILLEMALYFNAVVRADRFSEGLSSPWQLRPHWTFGVLAAIFVGELFMGAVLDLILLPGTYSGALPALALAGGAGPLLYNAFYNGFWFVALVAGSTWFLAMMGIEMGILVVFKLRETKSLENKIRMYLMMGSYAAFATFFPSFYYSALFPNAPSGLAVPVLGWSMGLGSAPIGPSVFLVVLLTYAITGSLAMLFGRRVVCSLFCTPALMYQGTTFNAMRSFNRSSPIARKYLSSRFSTIYSTTTGVTMASLVAVSFLSYFDGTGLLSITILGADPSVFFFSLSFGVLWFIIFVTIPYTGSYNCVTMGWCYTGTIVQAFQRIGFFKLKVRDKQVCRDCKTLDCAKGCPVGLVDMPGHFRQKGEFRSSKCCGVGNCVEACPYGNLYIYDVRHWVRGKLRFPLRRRPTVELPMVHARPASRPSVVPPPLTSTIVSGHGVDVGRPETPLSA